MECQSSNMERAQSENGNYLGQNPEKYTQFKEGKVGIHIHNH